ncbi:4-hydroxyphenylpyruvate dioxygenase [Dactylosporangium sp. NPDC049525]|uniref:4-hydroxyphenylpyruvate dioxygenase n=1 Tax=Dactylosporangium sp. NPDC049525 TaxID=3154730 RepID=UPI0034370A7E
MANIAAPGDRVFANMGLDHVMLYVEDVRASVDWFTRCVGLQVVAGPWTDQLHSQVRSVTLGRGQIRLVLAQPLADDHPGAAYLAQHGDGVADIALRVWDATSAFDEAVGRGAAPVAAPTTRAGVRTATIMGVGDVTHTFVDYGGSTGVHADVSDPPVPGLCTTDHFAVCVEAGQLDPTVAFYEQALGFSMVFAERISVGGQAIQTKAVQSSSGAVTLTLIEPDASKDPGQIDQFLKAHGGPGVQHIALATDDIVETVAALRDAGMGFLSTPATYYTMLADRLTLARHTREQLQALNVLVDQDHDGQLFQIFAKSVHPRNTVFLEIIERLGAHTFGGANITALYQAVEMQRAAQDDGR